MTDPLLKLKEAMNQTVFRDMHFSEQQKKSTLALAGDQGEQKIMLLILKALQRDQKSGYQILQDLQRSDAGECLLQNEGNLYVILHRLEQMRLIRSMWAEDKSGRLKTYYLDQKGTRCLAELEQEHAPQSTKRFFRLGWEGGQRV